MNKIFLNVTVCALVFVFLLPLQAGAVRLKNIASVKGVRDNQLVGYGVVVGLDGTGDGNKASFTTKGLANMLKNMGMPVNQADIKVSNVAGVIITATLPPFFKSGQTIDVTLSSLGDASSLQGGTLVTTPLKGLDGEVYAIAQGAVSIGGFAVQSNQNTVQKNHLTVARIPNGATVEREVAVNFSGKDQITFSLNSPDFTTVSRMVHAVDTYLAGKYAVAVDGATVNVTVPEKYRQKEITLLADLENINITTDSLARVVIDERTGTVVMGSDVQIGELALSHGNLSVQISGNQRSVISGELLSEEKAAMNNAQGGENKGRLINLNPGVTLGELVRALNSVGVAPRDLIAIFQTIKAAGAMQAELEII